MGENYEVWLKWRVYHDYYPQGMCRSVALEPMREMYVWMKRRGVVWKKTGENEWAILGKSEEEWEKGDRIGVKCVVTHPVFYYVTETEMETDCREVDLDGKKKGEVIDIIWQSKRLYWEYLFIPRKREETGILELQEKGRNLRFGAPEEVEVFGKRAIKIRSTEKISLRQQYPYRIQLWEQKSLGRKILSKQVPFPQPGMFLQADGECIQQIIYY